MVLLLAIGLGVLIASWSPRPTVLRGQWNGARLRRQVSGLEEEKAALERRIVHWQPKRRARGRRRRL